MFRVFITNDGTSPRVKFNQQLETIKNASTKNLIMIGDFNIDSQKNEEVPISKFLLRGRRPQVKCRLTLSVATRQSSRKCKAKCKFLGSLRRDFRWGTSLD